MRTSPTPASRASPQGDARRTLLDRFRRSAARRAWSTTRWPTTRIWRRPRRTCSAARAARRLAGFDQFPTVTAARRLHAQCSNRSSNCPASISTTGSSTPREAGFDGLWELDLFGRVRRNVEAARADVGASAATLQDARVSVIAEVARDYFILRGLQDQLALTQRNADNQSSTLKLTRVRLEAGRGNELDTSRAEAQWQTTLSSIPTLRGLDRHDHLSLERPDRPATRRRSRDQLRRRSRCRSCRPSTPSARRSSCCAAGPMCASRNGGSPPPRRASAWPWAICFPK